MRRLVAGLLLGCFLTLIGLQAVHHHKAQTTADHCSVCALAQQAVRQAPKAAPSVCARLTAFAVVLPSFRAPALERTAERRARAPPTPA